MAARSNSADIAQERVVVITRILDAPREMVFKAWTRAEYLEKWWGPKGFSVPSCKVDFRVGGALKWCMRSPQGQDYWASGVYREIVHPERIVLKTNALASENGPAILEGLTTVTFVEEGRKTKVSLRATAVGLTEAASGPLQGMEAGWTQTFDRFVEYVTNA